MFFKLYKNIKNLIFNNLDFLKIKAGEYLPSIIILVGFALFFTHDIFTHKAFFTHPDLRLYYPYREWFVQELLHRHFPLWNPYWGIGLPAIEWATIPIDIYTPLEMIFGSQYHYYQAIQALFILLACFYVFLKLGFKPFISTAGSILFFMAPWVTYFYFYFFTATSYIANALLFLFIYQWFKTKNSKYLFFIAFTTIFSLFGTKFEYWFYQTAFYTFFSIFGGIIFSTENKFKTLKNIALPIFAMYTGLLCQSWQINIAINAMKLSGRTGDASFLNLFSLEMYKNLLLSISHSFLCNLILLGLLLYWSYIHKKNFLWKFLILALTLNWIFNGELIIILILFLLNPIFIGFMLALLVSLFVYKNFNKKELFKTTLLFLLLVFYWCRPGRGDLGELEILNKAPALFQVLLSFLFWFGCKQFWHNKLTKLAYFSMLFMFLAHYQGQIILSYLTGLLWIPTRDNYIIDFAMTVIAMTGLKSLTEAIDTENNENWFNSKIIAKYIPILSISIVIFSSANNFYYIHPLMIKTGNSLPYFADVNKMKKVIKNLSEDSELSRIFFDFSKWPDFGFNYGSASNLLEKTSQVQLYDSLIPKNYRDWCIYKNTGIKPEQNWSDYPNEYTDKTVATLPHKRTYGYNRTNIYISTVLAKPPFEKNALKSLGVNYLISMFPQDTTFSNTTIKDFDLENINERKDLKFPDINKSFYTAKIKNTLPRAFTLNVPEKAMPEFNKEMDLIINEHSIKAGTFDFPYNSANIEKYEPEKISITAKGGENKYLVLLDLYHPFWHAKIDGKETEVLQAFYIFRAVKVPSGNHNIEFYYKIPYFKESILISIFGFLGLLSVFIFKFHKK